MSLSHRHWGLDACHGVLIAWREERNFRFHIVSMLAVLCAGWYFDISRTEWAAIILVIGMVLTAETFNTAIEEFCDMVKNDPDPHIGKIKDLAAAAVLLSAVCASVVGCIVFIPHLTTLLS